MSGRMFVCHQRCGPPHRSAAMDGPRCVFWTFGFSSHERIRQAEPETSDTPFLFMK